MVHPCAAISLVICAGGVEGVEVIMVVDVEVNRVDADNGAVFFVELFDLEAVLISVGIDVAIKLVPERAASFCADQTCTGSRWVDGLTIGPGNFARGWKYMR